MKRNPDPFDKYAEQLPEDMKKSGREIKSSGEAEDIMAHMPGRLLTKMPDGEMTNHLGCGKGEARLGDSERNGHSSKTMKSPKVGSVRVDVPRDRKSRFQPGIIPKHKQNPEGFGDKILALYARGMTVREIQGFLYDEYGMETSAEFISGVTDAILPELGKMAKPAFEPCLSGDFLWRHQNNNPRR